MKAFSREEYVDANEEVALLDGEYDRICRLCGRRFITHKRQAFMCPECRKERRHIAGTKGGKGAQEAWKKKHGGGCPLDARADDVPDVPSEEGLYYSEADKIKKTAPIEAHMGPYKPEATEGEETMDGNRNELLKSFPSSSNRLEHPEMFTQPTATTMEPEETEADVKAKMDSMVRDIARDRKGMLLAMYDGMTALGEASGMTFDEILDRMSRLHSALN